MFNRLLAISLLLSCTALAQINNGGGGSNGGGNFSGPTQNTYQIQSTPCGSNTNCTQIQGDGQVVLDATTNSTTTITCPNNDCNFVAGDVGKSVWVVQKSGGAYALTTGSLICGNSNPIPTITTVNGAQSITISGSNCTASVAGAAILVWGHKDGATLHAINPGCLPVYMASNLNVLVDDSFLTTVAACAASTGLAGATGQPQPSFYGAGTSTNFIITPDFKWADCTGAGAVSGGVCIGSGLGQIWNLVIWGSGASAATTTNCANANGKVVLAHSSTSGAMYFTNVSGICPGQSGLTGAELNVLDDQWNEGGVQNVGSTALVISNKGINTSSLDNLELGVPGTNAIGLSVLAAGQLNDYGTYLTACAQIAGTMTSRNSHFVTGGASSFPCQAAIYVLSGGKHFSDGDFIGPDAAGSVGMGIASGGVATARNSQFKSSGGSNVAISDAGTFIDHGGNTVTGGTVQTSALNMSGTQILGGYCTGTATGATTIGLFGLGQSAASTCTSTTVTQGIVMLRAGTILNLSATSSAGGVNASSGVLTVLKNGSATTSTCTFGTATTCQDFTHQPTFVAGDVISVQFTTQTSETLANVKAFVVAW